MRCGNEGDQLTLGGLEHGGGRRRRGGHLQHQRRLLPIAAQAAAGLLRGAMRGGLEGRRRRHVAQRLLGPAPGGRGHRRRGLVHLPRRVLPVSCTHWQVSADQQEQLTGPGPWAGLSNVEASTTRCVASEPILLKLNQWLTEPRAVEHAAASAVITRWGTGLAALSAAPGSDASSWRA